MSAHGGGGHASGGGGKWKAVLLWGIIGGLGLWAIYATHRGHAEGNDITQANEAFAQMTAANAAANAKIAELTQENAELKIQVLKKDSQNGTNPPPPQNPPSTPAAATAPTAAADDQLQAGSEEPPPTPARGRIWPFEFTVTCRLAGDVTGTLICPGTITNVSNKVEEITFQNPQSPTDNLGDSLWTDNVRFVNANYDRTLLPGQAARFIAKFTGASRQSTSATITFRVIIGNSGSLPQGVGISGIPVV